MALMGAAGIGSLGSIAGGLFGSSKAAKAMKAQAEAINKYTRFMEQAQKDQNLLSMLGYAQGLSYAKPVEQISLGAYNQLANMLGISPATTQATQDMGYSTPYSGNQLTLPSGQVITLPGGYDLSSLLSPVTAAGITAPTETGALLSRGMTESDLQTYLNPYMDWESQLGQEAIKAAAAHSGTFGSGSMGTALADYMNKIGQSYYTQAFENKQTDLNRMYNELLNLATGGASSAQGGLQTGTAAGSSLGTSATGQAENIGSGISALGTAQASGILGQASAWGNTIADVTKQIQSALGTYGQNQQYQNLLSAYSSPTGYGNALSNPYGAYLAY